VTNDWIFCGRKNYEQTNATLVLSLYQELGAAGGQNDQISNFDEVPPDWRCPCCLRQKRAIARLNGRGELWCPLHGHHDHVLDGVYGDGISSSLFAARDELYAKLGWTGLMTDPRNRETEALDRFLRRFHRFDEELICADCNTADAAAKRYVGAPSYFTFTPFEIAKFARPNFRRRHDIVQERAMEIYKWAGPQVEDTVARARAEITAFVDQIVAASRAATRHEPPARQERRR
jgi:rubredoxin